MGDSFELSAEYHKFWQVDFQRGVIKVVLQDGRTFEDKLEAAHRPDNSQVSMSIYDWERSWIICTTLRGDATIAEGFNPNAPPSLNGRPSVYLDQNKWRMISDVLGGNGQSLDVGERRAAADLIFLAQDAGVVLPLSMGRMIETSRLYGERRYDVGLTMAQLSGGWQIRNPIDLWKFEADATMRNHLGTGGPTDPMYPVTTEPGALFGADAELGVLPDMPDSEKLMAMLTMPSVVLDALLDPETLPRASVETWVQHHARITAQLRDEKVTKERRRAIALRRYWNENLAFYVAAHKRHSGVGGFPSFSNRQLARMFRESPMVGLLSELFIRRFVDQASRWRDNDLIDIFHLSGAAAYADYVCAETHTGTQLRDAQKALGRRQTVFTTLSDLVQRVRADGARAASEGLSDLQVTHREGP